MNRYAAQPDPEAIDAGPDGPKMWSQNLVVLYESSAGTSLCSAYHPPEYVRRELAGDLDVVTFRAAADDGRHDIHVLRKPSNAAAAS